MKIASLCKSRYLVNDDVGGNPFPNYDKYATSQIKIYNKIYVRFITSTREILTYKKNQKKK